MSCIYAVYMQYICIYLPSSSKTFIEPNLFVCVTMLLQLVLQVLLQRLWRDRSSLWEVGDGRREEETEGETDCWGLEGKESR